MLLAACLQDFEVASTCRAGPGWSVGEPNHGIDHILLEGNALTSALLHLSQQERGDSLAPHAAQHEVEDLSQADLIAGKLTEIGDTVNQDAAGFGPARQEIPHLLGLMEMAVQDLGR